MPWKWRITFDALGQRSRRTASMPALFGACLLSIAALAAGCDDDDGGSGADAGAEAGVDGGGNGADGGKLDDGQVSECGL